MNDLIIIGKDNDIGLKARNNRVGPELDLVNDFIDEIPKLFKTKKNKLALFIEPLVDMSYPDIIVTEYDPRVLEKWNKKRELLDKTDFKIFENIRLFGGLNSDELSKKTNFQYKTLLPTIEKLLDAALIDRKSGKWEAQPLKDTYSLKRLVSIEAKMKEWKTLLSQADSNFWFSSESYALSSVKNPRETTINKFKNYGVGLYSLSNQKVIKLNESKKQSLPNSYMSWMVNEWVGKCIT